MLQAGQQVGQCGNVAAGSTQEEVGALVQRSIQDAQISGGDRPVVWDGATRGQDLTTQLKNIRDQQV